MVRGGRLVWDPGKSAETRVRWMRPAQRCRKTTRTYNRRPEKCCTPTGCQPGCGRFPWPCPSHRRSRTIAVDIQFRGGQPRRFRSRLVPPAHYPADQYQHTPRREQVEGQNRNAEEAARAVKRLQQWGVQGRYSDDEQRCKSARTLIHIRILSIHGSSEPRWLPAQQQVAVAENFCFGEGSY